jgi:hypothetical protein
LIIILLGVLWFGGNYYHKKITVKNLRNKIAKMKIEKENLVDLMKKTQIERFKKNTMSGIVYNIRTKKYQERINKISQSLPVLESRLNNLLKKKKEIGIKKKLEKTTDLNK